MTNTTNRPRIFTWHTHGNYLFYLTQANCEFYIPYDDARSPGYAGKTINFPFGDNVHEVHINTVKDIMFDVILFQDDKQYLADQYSIFTQQQLALPKIYLEHDPPRDNPAETKHTVDDPKMLIVHVTYFNQLMWDNNRTPTKVIEHGVLVPDTVHYTGETAKGIVMVNNINSNKRGLRRMGYDIFEYTREQVPLDIVGMGSKEIGGIGEIPYETVHVVLSKYRFFFNPIRYTSLGLSVCEAMMIGIPIIGIATTEMVRTIENGVSGYVDTHIGNLITRMKELLNNPEKAMQLGRNAQKLAQKRFAITRFTTDWENTFIYLVTNGNVL